MSDVLDEISEDLRHQKLIKFWKENGAWIIGGAIAAVILTAAIAFWRQWTYERNTFATTELTRLVSTARPADMESFAVGSDKNHALLARFIAAGTHLDRGEKDKALALYNEISDTSGIDKTWRSLARVLSIGLRLEKDAPEHLEEELDDLSGEGDAWRYTALELKALLAARQGQWQKAVSALIEVTADPQAPPDARARAFALRELYMGEIKTPGGSKTAPKT